MTINKFPVTSAKLLSTSTKLRYDPAMHLPFTSRRIFGRKIPSVNLTLPFVKQETKLFKTVGWVSAGLGAVALGLVVGNEIRQRYKFNRRTPYDNFGHSGDESHEMDFGLGV